MNARSILIAAIALSVAIGAVAETSHMIGRQSNNVGMPLLPAPGRVKIDGDLADWDWSGRIWVFADTAIRSRFSVEAAAMWSNDALYLAAKWKDPTPMFSTINPDFNPNEGWKSDSWQLRVKTDRVCHLTTWFFTSKKMPVMHVSYSADGLHGENFVLANGEGPEIGRGVQMAYRPDADGKGYSQEIRVPWGLIYTAVPEIKPGLVFRLGNEFLWGPPTGGTWPIHRYADNMQPGVTSREFYWTAQNAWGDATLLAAGNVPMRQYVTAEGKLAGTVPVRATIPKNAARFTIAINGHDPDLPKLPERRIRNLAGDFDPEQYTVAVNGDTRTVEVMWDCMDDLGRLVPPGTYSIAGLTHEGLGAEYDTCFYNPGTPPWATKDGRGAWGADHCPPGFVAASGDWIIVAWPFAEGGSGIIGIDPSGKKKWGEKRGVSALAADDKCVYALANTWYVSGALCRLGKTDGSYQPFELDGKKRPFELTLKDVLGDASKMDVTARETYGAKVAALGGVDKVIEGSVSAMASDGRRLALSLACGQLAVLDATSAALLRLLDVPKAAGLAFADDGTLYALIDGAVSSVNMETGALAKIPTPKLGSPTAIAVDHSGNIVVADRGPDCQLKVYTPAGKLVTVIGKRGGRPIRGKFIPDAMMAMSSVAVDSRGRIWVVENWNNPRRVSVWDADGDLARDYIGNTGYAGTTAYLHDEDPTLAYVGPVEMKLDRKNNTWKVTRILWVPDESKGEAFPLWPHTAHWFSNPAFVKSSASGKERRYLYFYDGYHAIYMERGDCWQPVAAVCLVGHFSGEIGYGGVVSKEPEGEFAGLNAYDGCFWSDTNRDARVQRSECIIIPATNPAKVKERGEASIKIRTHWGSRLGSDLRFYAEGITVYEPAEFTRDGAPIYKPGRQMTPRGSVGVDIVDIGEFVPVAEENLLLDLSNRDYPGPCRLLGITYWIDKPQPKPKDANAVQTEFPPPPMGGARYWSFPNRYPGVHGSHRAPMPSPGTMIGGLKILGTARVNEDVGRVFAIRGNLGQDFFFTTDGFYVGALFQDCRLPSDGLPDTEDALRGMPMEGFSEGGEPFNGWFGRQSDGKIRMTTGMPREAAMIVEIKGLETVKRFRAPAVSVDAAALVKAEQENAARAAAAAVPPVHTIRRMANPPAIDGNPADWAGAIAMKIEREGSPNRGSARIAYDDAHLYVLFEMQDSSPWLNEGKDYTRLFKTGDAADLQFCADPAAPAKRSAPVPGDNRLVFADFAGKPAAVLMKAIDKTAAADAKVNYHSPVGDVPFERVEVLGGAKVAVAIQGQSVRVEAAIPLAAIGLKPVPGITIRGDAGIISSDAQGLVNVARTYWANKMTNLVNDLPSEARLLPDAWGEWKFE